MPNASFSAEALTPTATWWGPSHAAKCGAACLTTAAQKSPLSIPPTATGHTGGGGG
jgi:hypothetical protein